MENEEEKGDLVGNGNESWKSKVRVSQGSGWEALGVKLARRSCPQDKDVGKPAGDNTAQYRRHSSPSSWGDSV